jgi:DNA-binding CsgD family transcriptional regulator
MKIPSIHDNMFIYPCQDGVKLISFRRNSKIMYGKLIQLAELHTYTFNTLFIDTKGICKHKNTAAATTFDHNLNNIYSHDICNSIVIVEENLPTHFGIKPFISFKIPWQNHQNQTIGVFICSILLGTQPLADSIYKIANMGILNFNEKSTLEFNKWTSSKLLSESQLTIRELEIVKHVTNGKTAKKIAEISGLSRRTVEHYVENIKFKLKVSSKSDLIEKVLAMM